MAHHCDCCDVSDEEIAKLRADLATAEAAIAASESRGFARGVEEAARLVEEERDGWEDDKGFVALDAVVTEIRALVADAPATKEKP